MIIANTLDLKIVDGRIVYDGKIIRSILVEAPFANRTISFSPKHRQSFLAGNVMVSKTMGIVYVPMDEVNTISEYVVLESDGSLSREPSLSYDSYLEEKRNFQERKIRELMVKEDTIKK